MYWIDNPPANETLSAIAASFFGIKPANEKRVNDKPLEELGRVAGVKVSRGKKNSVKGPSALPPRRK